MQRGAALAPGVAWLLLLGCAGPPEGEARVEVALPEQALNIVGAGPVADANLHSDEDVTVNLLRLTAPVVMHRHLESEEILYVVSGEGVLRLKGSDRALAAGDVVIVPRNTPHGFDPTGTQPAILLQLFTPRFVQGDRQFEAARR